MDLIPRLAVFSTLPRAVSVQSQKGNASLRVIGRWSPAHYSSAGFTAQRASFSIEIPKALRLSSGFPC
ncbi:hypothetical protein ACKLNR_012338 [Fusarium oxysporum f. sp. zingiberi]